MKYYPLVLGALWRNPGETLLTWLAATVAFTLFGLMVGLYMYKQHLVDSARDDRALVVMRFPEIPYIGLPEALREKLNGVEGVTAVGTAHSLDGHHSDPRVMETVLAVDEGMPAALPEIPMTPSDWKMLFSTPNGAYVTHKTAARYHLKAGDLFQFTSDDEPQANGNPTREFQILGEIGEIPNWQGGLFVGNYRYVNNSEPPGKKNWGNMFYVAFADPKRGNDLCHMIDAQFANSGTPTLCMPRKVDALIAANSGVNMAALTLSVAGAGLFMVLFLIGNVLARSVSERISEFAILRTVGFQQSHLWLLVGAEAAFPCLLGVVAGLGLAFVLTRVSRHLLTGNMARLLSNQEFSLSLIAVAVGFALLLALICTVIPLQRLRRMSLVDVLAGS